MKTSRILNEASYSLRYAMNNWRKPQVRATFYLVLLSIQFPVLEGWNICYDKIFFMCLTPFMLLCLPRPNLKALQYSCFYLLGIVLSLIFSEGQHSITSLAYTLSFLLTYSYYYALIARGAFSYEYFIKFLRTMILLYVLAIPIQQTCAILGVTVPFLNCYGFVWGWKFPSLCIEPSHAARLLMVYFLVFIQMLHIKEKKALSFQYLWEHERNILLAFCYGMLTVGSATAAGGFLLVFMYILAHTRASIAIGFIFVGICFLPYAANFEAFSRFFATLQASTKFDSAAVLNADVSAAARVNVLLSFFENFDLSSHRFWFGGGIKSTTQTIGIVAIYGFCACFGQIAMLLKLAFRTLFSTEVLIFILFLSMTIGNVAYAWACVMLWTALKYFSSMRNTAE